MEKGNVKLSTNNINYYLKGEEINNQLRLLNILGLILLVVLVGTSAFYFSISYMYEEEVSLSSCDLCFKINPDLKACEFYKPVNFSNLTIIKKEYG